MLGSDEINLVFSILTGTIVITIIVNLVIVCLTKAKVPYKYIAVAVQKCCNDAFK